MQNISDIRRRIRSIEQTRQITRAMYMLSSAQMKKAMTRYENNHVFFDRIRATMKDILTHSPHIEHPYITPREGNRVAYVVIAGDKGMAGGYNHNVLQFALEQMKDKQPYVLTVGSLACSYFTARGYKVDMNFVAAAQNPALYECRQVAEVLIGLFDDNLIDEVYVCYTRYLSSMRQVPAMIKLLPLEIRDFDDVQVEYEYQGDMIYEPSPSRLFATLVPQYVIGELYGVLVQSAASEHCARMTAMDSATRNADEMLAKLKQQYSTARQFAITREISEVVGTAEALVGERRN